MYVLFVCVSMRSCDGAGDDIGVRVPTSRSGAETAAPDRAGLDASSSKHKCVAVQMCKERRELV